MSKKYLGEDGLRVVASKIIAHTANISNPHEVNAEQIGLGNVANILQYSEGNPPHIR